jgi:hypothetical protein
MSYAPTAILVLGRKSAKKPGYPAGPSHLTRSSGNRLEGTDLTETLAQTYIFVKRSDPASQSASQSSRSPVTQSQQTIWFLIFTSNHPAILYLRDRFSAC